MDIHVIKFSESATKDGIITNEFSDELMAIAKPRNIKLEFVLVTSNGADMNTLKELVENGVLKPHVSQTFHFAELAEAHKQIESGRTVGKAVVVLS